MKKILIIIVCFIVCGCNKVNNKDIYDEYVSKLRESEEVSCPLIDVSFNVTEISSDYINYYVLINRNDSVMNDIRAILIHDKETSNLFPSIGIYDDKVSLSKKSDKLGVKLSGYLEVNESTNFKLYLEYLDDNSVKQECVYVYNYQHN